MSEKWIKTHCARFDHGGCGLEVLVKDGKLVKIRADKTDAYSEGYCCPKGLAGIDRACHPARLRQPLLRRGPRGEGEWEAIPWERALDILVSEFRSAMAGGGPESVAFCQGAPRGLEFFILLRLANLLNCPNVGAAQHVCHMPREQMAAVTCGFFPVPDYDSPTRCVLLWGSDPQRTNEEGILGVRFQKALKQGAGLIVVDPLKSGPARTADLWLQIRPGTDDLLAVGLLHVIIEEGLFDRPFVERWTTGFAELRAAVRPFDPATVSLGTGIPAERITSAARLYAKSRPAMIHWGNAVEHSANTSQTCRSLVLLMALTGNLEAPGGNVKAEAPNVMRPAELICLKQFPGRIDKLPNRTWGLIPRLLTVPNWILFHSILDASPYAVQCLYVQATNPLISCSEADKVLQALLKLDFLAVADIFMTPTAAFADLVLPAATHLEYNDIGHYGLPHGLVFARPKAVDPPGDAWPDIRILNEWGKRMGFGSPFWDTEDRILEAVLEPSGLTYGAFAAKGLLSGPRTHYSYREKGFATPSGKVELHSSLLEQWGYSPVPTVGVHAGTDERFPFLLTSRKPRFFFHSAYRQIESLRERTPRPTVMIHPDTASRLGIAAGTPVRISTVSGSVTQFAELTRDIDPEVIFADFGWWFPERADEMFAWKESNLNQLTGAGGPTDPIMGTVQLRAIPCSIEKAESVPAMKSRTP